MAITYADVESEILAMVKLDVRTPNLGDPYGVSHIPLVLDVQGQS